MKSSTNPSPYTLLRSAIRTATAILAGATLLSTLSSQAADQEDDVLLGKLKESKHSLVEGITQSEKENGVAISAKFEMDGEKLMLSVYTAKAGLGSDSESNTLIELGGEATKTPWVPEIEVSADKKHLTRSATQLTLVQVSRLTLLRAIDKASAAQPGTVYSITPAVKEGNPVFEVKIANPEGKSVQVLVNGVTGVASK